MYKLPVIYNDLEPYQRREVREQYIKEQKGLCFWCKKPLKGPAREDVNKAWIRRGLFPKGFFKYPVHLQHDHDTGLTEGAVHAKCNAYMWQYHKR